MRQAFSLIVIELTQSDSQLSRQFFEIKKFQETQVELQRKKLQQLVQQQQAKHQIDTSFIKSEPASDDDVSLRFTSPK